MDAKVIGNVMPVLEVTLNRSAHSIGIAEGSGEANGTRTAELTNAASPVATGDAFNRASTAAVDAASRIGMAPPAKGPPKPPANATRRIGVPPPAAPTLTLTPPTTSSVRVRRYRPRRSTGAPAFSLRLLCVNRCCRNCRVGAGRAGRRGWRHNRDEHPVVGELLAHCDRVVDTGSDGTPSGRTPSGGTPNGGTPTAAPQSRGTRQGSTPSGGTAASSAFGADVTVRPPIAAAFVSITNNANKPAVGCVYRSVAVAGTATLIHWPLR